MIFYRPLGSSAERITDIVEKQTDMTQEVEHLNPDEFWRTYDLGLCSALFCLEHELCEIEKGDNPNKAQFVFRRDKNLQKHIEDYWNDCLKLNVRSYFDAIRCVKNRLYSS